MFQTMTPNPMPSTTKAGRLHAGLCRLRCNKCNRDSKTFVPIVYTPLFTTIRQHEKQRKQTAKETKALHSS